MAKFETGTTEALTSWTTNGGFLCSGTNVMTASWGFLGVMWGKKVVIVPVRDSRFTKKLLDETGEFTFSVPKMGEMRQELAFCGSKSGRDMDKFQGAGLEKIPAKAVKTNIVGGCEKYFECKVLMMNDMKNVDMSAFADWYKIDDRHNFYFGEVVAEY